jgi:hypothetical protein
MSKFFLSCQWVRAVQPGLVPTLGQPCSELSSQVCGYGSASANLRRKLRRGHIHPSASSLRLAKDAGRRAERLAFAVTTARRRQNVAQSAHRYAREGASVRAGGGDFPTSTRTRARGGSIKFLYTPTRARARATWGLAATYAGKGGQYVERASRC